MMSDAISELVLNFILSWILVMECIGRTIDGFASALISVRKPPTFTRIGLVTCTFVFLTVILGGHLG